MWAVVGHGNGIHRQTYAEAAANAGHRALFARYGALVVRRAADIILGRPRAHFNEFEGAGRHAEGAAGAVVGIDKGNALVDINGVVGADLYTVAKAHTAIAAPGFAARDNFADLQVSSPRNRQYDPHELPWTTKAIRGSAPPPPIPKCRHRIGAVYHQSAEVGPLLIAGESLSIGVAARIAASSAIDAGSASHGGKGVVYRQSEELIGHRDSRPQASHNGDGGTTTVSSILSHPFCRD